MGQQAALGRVRRREIPTEALEEPVQRPAEHQEQQLVLLADVVIEAGQRQSSRVGDLPHRRLMEAAARDHAARRVQDDLVPLADRHSEPPANQLFGWPLP